MSESEQPTGAEKIRPPVEQTSKYLKRSIGIYRMSRHYWREVLGRDFVSKKDFKVASLGAGDATEAIPFTCALEDESEADLERILLKTPIVSRKGRKTILTKPDEPKIKVFSFDYDVEEIKKIRENPFLRGFNDPKKFVQADLRFIPVADQFFDVCLVRNPYWDELEESGEVEKAFTEFGRVLKPGGVLWMTFLSEEEYKAALNLIEPNEQYKIKFSGESGFQVAPGINPRTGEPWPWDKFILIAVVNTPQVMGKFK